MQLAAFDYARGLIGVAHHFLKFGGGDPVARHIDFAVLQAQQGHDRLLPHFEGYAVEIGQPFAPVVFVLFKHQTLANDPFAQFEGTGAHGGLAEIGARFFDRFFCDDGGKVQAHNVQESRIRT